MDAQSRPGSAHTPHDSIEVNFSVAAAMHSERFCRTDIIRSPAGPDHSLGGDAACDQAVTAQKPALDERDPGSKARRARSRYKTRGSCPDHDEIVLPGRLGILPVRRMRILH